MIKILWLLKRKAGITPQQFRERYERHSRLGQKLCGHLQSSYKRNYKIEVMGGGTPTTHDGSTTFGPIEWEYDCISEVSFPNEEAYNERKRIFADPVTAKQFHDDEEDFLDRKAVIMFRCEEVDTGTDPRRKSG
jgi:EthD domain